MAYVQENWFDIMTSSLVIVGSIILLLSLTISNSSIVYVSIVGYSLIIFSILLILVNIFNSVLKVTGGNLSTFLPIFVNNTGPFLLNIAVVLFLLSMMIIYTSKINEGHLSSLYYSFSKLAIFLIFIQMIVFYYGMKSNSYKISKRLPAIYTNFSYLVGVINVYIAWIIQTILKNYTTDG